LNFQGFDSEYIRRLKDGDVGTADHFAKYFRELLFLKLRGRLRSRQLIDDVIQETLMRVLDAVRNKAGPDHPERFGAYVNSFCNHVLQEQYRAEGRLDSIEEHNLEPPDQSVDLDAPLVNSNNKRSVKRVLDELPAKDRELLKEVYLDEEDKSVICRRHKVDARYLRVLVYRAKSRFRTEYGKQCGWTPLKRGSK
jgi:RNA polymerase sigma-70 factor, ECF subfamily